MADASHELRTPLTVLDARLQLLQRSLAADDPSTPTVDQLRRDTTTLIAIVNDLLALAEVDGELGRSDGIDLTPILERSVAAMTILAAERSVAIHLEAGDQTATAVPASSMQRCIVALLDNALHFSPSGSTIEVSVARVKTSVVIRVRDHGPGITGIEPSRIFDRFARSGDAIGGGGSSRTGFGIGLSLVRDTVARFGGAASVFETSPAGTTIELRIPEARAHQRSRAALS